MGKGESCEMAGSDSRASDSVKIEGLRQHMQATEDGIRALPGIDGNTAEKLIKSLRKRHAKVLRRIARSQQA